MIRDGKISFCNFNIDEKKLIDNCTHDSLCLCQNKGRCLPNNFKCDNYIQCIDGSYEIEQCAYPKYFR